MSNTNPSRCWTTHGFYLATVLFFYALAVLLCGKAYPSVRFAHPVQIAPNFKIADGGEVYMGRRVVFGWPLACVGWREEARGPFGTPGASEMRIVAVRVSALATTANFLAAAAAYGLVAALASLFTGQRRSLKLLLVGLSCISVLAGVAILSQWNFLDSISIYADEAG